MKLAGAEQRWCERLGKKKKMVAMGLGSALVREEDVAADVSGLNCRWVDSVACKYRLMEGYCRLYRCE